MTFRELMNDLITLVKQDGARHDNIRAAVQPELIITDEPRLPIESGDIFERKLVSGVLEQYEVIFPGFIQGTEEIPSHYQTSVRQVTTSRRGSEQPTSKLKLFVSHSSKDQCLAELLVKLLQKALTLKSRELRCTSVDGYRLPGGAETEKHLRREVQEAITFVGIISSASLDSMYVMFELGARWGAQRHLIPLLTPEIDIGLLKGPLRGINALQLDNSSQLHQLINDLASVLSITAEPAAAYQSEIDSLLTYCSSLNDDSTGERLRNQNTPVRSASLSTTQVEHEILGTLRVKWHDSKSEFQITALIENRSGHAQLVDSIELSRPTNVYDPGKIPAPSKANWATQAFPMVNKMQRGNFTIADKDFIQVHTNWKPESVQKLEPIPSSELAIKVITPKGSLTVIDGVELKQALLKACKGVT